MSIQYRAPTTGTAARLDKGRGVVRGDDQYENVKRCTQVRLRRSFRAWANIRGATGVQALPRLESERACTLSTATTYFVRQRTLCGRR